MTAVKPEPHHIDPHDLGRAWRLLRSAAEGLERIAREEGWPAPFKPVQYLVLTELGEATAYGLSARRLARSLSVRPSTLAYHLDALERAGLVRRAPWTVHDRRKVAVRLTGEGRHALRRLSGARYPPILSPAIASP